MKDCAECKKLKRYDMLEFARTCKGYQSYDPADIAFCPKQIEWLLTNYETLRSGKWASPTSNYTDAPITSKHSFRNAAFVSPIEVCMELDRRLEHCKYDGLVTFLHYADNKDLRFLSSYCNPSEDVVRLRIESVVYHISGYNFNKSFRYDRWRAIRDYKLWQGRE